MLFWYPPKNLIKCWRLQAFCPLEQYENHGTALALDLLGPVPPLVWFSLLSSVFKSVNATCPMFNFSIRPNIFLGVTEGSAQYKRWYFELIVDQVDPFLTAEPTHLRLGWASSSGYAPYPGGGEGWGGNGVGDDLYSYGFDGLHLWSGEYLAKALAPYLFLGMIRAWIVLAETVPSYINGTDLTVN